MSQNSKSKRDPSGAAVAGAFPRPKRFPRQLVVMVSEELAERIESSARNNAMSKSEVARLFIEAGIEAAEADAAAASARITD